MRINLFLQLSEHFNVKLLISARRFFFITLSGRNLSIVCSNYTLKKCSSLQIPDLGCALSQWLATPILKRNVLPSAQSRTKCSEYSSSDLLKNHYTWGNKVSKRSWIWLVKLWFMPSLKGCSSYARFCWCLWNW